VKALVTTGENTTFSQLETPIWASNARQVTGGATTHLRWLSRIESPWQTVAALSCCPSERSSCKMSRVQRAHGVGLALVQVRLHRNAIAVKATGVAFP